ncbi:MAG TPA: hypothetical protein VFE65_29430 [Pseudonocardia sp.]|nr:hypothetical protein [Pseudonocardia sp.]
MSERLKLWYELACAWCGMIFAVGYTASLAFVAGFLPPASPNLDKAHLAQYFVDHHSGVAVGATLASIFGAFLLPWSAQLTIQMARIEGARPVLSIVQGFGNAVTSLIITAVPLFWVTMTYRTDASPDSIQTLNDLSWIFYCMSYMLTTFAWIAMGLVGLAEKSKPRLFPPWVCFLSIITGLLWIFNDAIPFTKVGPLAWDGLITYYLLFTLWLGGHFITAICTILEVRRRMKSLDIDERAEVLLTA